jgi:translation elongation factor Ts
MINANSVKELREKTGAGMMDCKKALTAVNGDMEKAVDWLREHGIAKAEKKQSRIAAEGLCQILVDGNNAVVVEVNSETDFVASNEKFINFVDLLAKAILENKVNTNEDVLNLVVDGETISEKLTNLVATIGEKLSFRRFVKVVKKDGDFFGVYKHMGGKIGALVTINGANEEVAKDVAMQAAAMNPIAAVRSEVPEKDVLHEKEVIITEIKNDPKNANKPDAILEKMSEGRLNKFFKEIVLEEQDFIKDSGLTVGQYVSNNGGKILSMVRFAVGEGIEKREENFAEEVASQIKNA